MTDNKHIEDNSEKEKIANLLKPRYKVIADYPKCPFVVGQLLSQDMESVGEIFVDISEVNETNKDRNWIGPDQIGKYPHLFRELQWWEEREEKDMPMYVTVRGEVYKVKEWDMGMVTPVEVFINPKIHKGYIDSCTECPLYGDILPATEKQYSEYIQKQKS